MKHKLLICILTVTLLMSLMPVPIFAIQDACNIYLYQEEYDFVASLDGEYYTIYNGQDCFIVDKTIKKYSLVSNDEAGVVSEDFVSIFDADAQTIIFTKLNGYSFVLESVYRSGVFLGGKCSVTNIDGYVGLIDTQGNYLLECEYDDIIYDKSDIFLVCKDNVWQLATLKNGEVSLEALVKSDVINPIKDSTMQNIIASDGDYYGMISSENKQLVEFKYEYIYDLTGGLYAGVNGNATDLISSDGSVTATLDALVLGEYSEGKIPCYANGKFFYVNRDGKTVLEVSVPDAMSIDSFYEGIAVIQLKDGSYSYLTENGDFATRAIWDYAARFARGYALVMDIDTSGVEAVRSWKIIDHNFNTVERLNVEVYVNEIEEHTTDFSNGFIRTVDNETGKMGFAYTDNTFAAHDCRSDGHIYGAWFVAKVPEVGVAGEKYVACVKCGEIMETELMDPLPTPDPEESETTESSSTSTSESTNTSSTSTSESTNTSSTSTSESTNTSSTSTSESTNTSATETTKKDDPKDPDDENKSGFMKFIDTLASIFGISSTTFMVIAGSVIAVVVIGVIGFIKFYYF